ncbi:MAG TPA: polysaccharide biosynthesis tyrosine autokinase [Candidatus Binataceae bacterium]
MTQPSPFFIRPTPPPADGSQREQRTLFFEQDESRLDIVQYWHTIRKHLRLIVTIFIAVTVLTTLRVYIITPMYTAAATLLLKPGTPTMLGDRGPQQDQEQSDSDFYENFDKTQYEILRSRSLAASVIRNEGLDHDPLFVGDGKPPQPGLIARARHWLATRVKRTGVAGTAGRGAIAPTLAKQSLGVSPGLIDSYLGGLQINPVSDTSLVKIAFTTPDPNLSARLANAHAHAYIRQGIDLHSQANEEAERFLKQKLVELKEQLTKSEIALNDYRREKGIIPGLMSLDGKETVVLDRVSELSKDLTTAQVERIGLEAQVQQINNHHYDALPAVMGNLAISGMQTELGSVDAEYASLSKQFKPDYPPLVQLQAKRQEIQGRINDGIRKVLESTQGAYEQAQTKEAKLQIEMDKERAQALGLNDAAVEYAILQREVDTNRELYNSVLQRMKDVGLAAEAQSSNILIVDEAEAPRGPSSPNRFQDIMRAAMVSLAGAVALAFLLEYLNNTLKTPDDVERVLRVPNLAVIPAFSRAGDKSYAPLRVREAESQLKLSYGRELVVAHGPYSLIGEAYRTLRTALMLSRAGSPPKTILFTSATNSEGKTVTAANTAVLFAHTGAKVILIDADLRRPRCHKIFAIDNHFGLTEALTGTRDLSELVRPTGIDGLSLLSSGSYPPNPTELLGSDKMRQTLIELCNMYELVIVDSPPLMPVSDGLLLSTMVDGVVLVVNSEQTAKQQVKAARARLEYARAKIFGVVLNKVNIQSPDYRYYQHYYYNHYSRYDPESAAKADAAEKEEELI